MDIVYFPRYRVATSGFRKIRKISIFKQTSMTMIQTHYEAKCGTAYRKNVNFDTASSKRANFDEIQFFLNIHLFGTHNLRTRTHNIESGARCKSVCTIQQDLSATSVSWDSVSSTAVSGHHRRRNWPVASATPSVSEGQGTPLLSIFCIKTGSFHSHPANNRPTNKRFFSEPPTISRRNMHYFRYAVWGTITW